MLNGALVLMQEQYWKRVPVFVLSIPSLWDFAREMRSHRGSVYCRAVAPDCIRLRRCLKCCVQPLSPPPHTHHPSPCGSCVFVAEVISKLVLRVYVFPLPPGSISEREREKKRKVLLRLQIFWEREREVEIKKREVKAGINASLWEWVRGRGREKEEAEGQINSWVFFLHRNDEIWCKQIWCIIIAALHCFSCFRARLPRVLVFFWLCVLSAPTLHKCLGSLFA